MKVYISIPIAGKDEKKQREKADRIKAMLSKKGYNVVNPFEIYSGCSPTYYDYICQDLRALADCDVIFLCKDWQTSKGCKVERFFAETYGKKIMFENVEEIERYWR